MVKREGGGRIVDLVCKVPEDPFSSDKCLPSVLGDHQRSRSTLLPVCETTVRRSTPDPSICLSEGCSVVPLRGSPPSAHVPPPGF